MTVMKPKSLLVMMFAAMFMTAGMTAPALGGPISWASGQDVPITHGIVKVKRKYRPWKQDPGYRVQNGPPPWAPAHGYRAKYPDIYSGSCDRSLVSSKLLGGAIGAVIGGLLGSKVGKGKGKLAATAVGVLAGALVGSSIAKGMDQGDNDCVRRTLEGAPDNKEVAWRNPDTGADYRIKPVKTYQKAGRYCREYTTTAVIAGNTQQTYGTACRQPDGSWELVN